MRAHIGPWLLAGAIIGCSPSDESATKVEPFPVFDEPPLVEGRAVWMDTCKGCHALGIAGAPRAGEAEAWEPRIARGRDTLYAHAIDGYFGPTHTHMPARGGNPDLSDAQVRAAVDYMLALLN